MIKQVKKVLLLLSLAAAGCCSTESASEMAKARQMVVDGAAQCLVLKDGKIIGLERGRGINPLLVMADKLGSEMEGGVIVDKVIGRAAATIAVNAKVSHVHGELMSEDAVEFLTKHKVTSSQTLLVPRILNRTRDGYCPMDMAVEGIDDPAKAVEAIRKKIVELSQQSKK